MTCSCGGDVKTIFYKGFVSHGTCDTCLKNFILPTYSEKEWKKYFGGGDLVE